MKNKIGILLAMLALAMAFHVNTASAYYDPELGRFIQPDTIIPNLSNPQSYNRYSYCVNDPLRYTDPTGHDPTIGLSFAEAAMTPQERVTVAKMTIPAVVGGSVAIASGGLATPLLVEAGAGPTFAAVGSGMVAGASGDVAAQGTQIGLGTRTSISGQEVAVSSLTGGALGGVDKALSTAGTPPTTATTTGSGTQTAASAAVSQNLGSLTPAQARQIQAFANRFDTEVNLVGSRAAGGGLDSDFDYVIGGNSKVRNAAEYFLPKGPSGTGANGKGIDVFNANLKPLDPSRPNVQFKPNQPSTSGGN
jgi:hypothetical protein